jgi:hypothetical protein
MKRRIALALLTALVTISASAGAPDNDASCDIKVGPAATLLLPYFEVALETTENQTTLFTITNVSRYSQIAHVTLWTDWSFPVLTFNIFLAGYDVQSINLKQILVSGIVASPAGTGPTTVKSPLGSLTSPANGGPGYANPNFKTAIECDALPGMIQQTVMAAVRRALTTGVAPDCTRAVGGVHSNAIGYATVDVVGSCTTRLPSDPLYYTTDLLFDNVLIGDYQQVGPQPAGAFAASFDAAGNPMVHLRAIPEGGSAGSTVVTELPYTFYDRYTPATNRLQDRRQPLPATFAARFIQGGVAAFATNYTIWREGFGDGSCNSSLLINAQLPIAEIVRFDERDNPFVNNTPCNILCAPNVPTLPATSSSSTASSIYPSLFTADVAGWMYLNLNNGGSTGYSVTTRSVGGVPTTITGPGSRSVLSPAGSGTVGPRPSQNWVTITMFGYLGTKPMVAEFDAASLGNGCTPAALITTANGGTGAIGPAGGVFVCPPGTTLANGTTALCSGTNINPMP